MPATRFAGPPGALLSAASLAALACDDEDGERVEFTAVSEISGSNGLIFDLHFVASVPAA